MKNKENNCVNGSVSKDFPLYHNDKIPIYTPLNNFIHHKNFSNMRMLYSNEHPDIFRLNAMKEGGYINPFLNNIDKVDREEYLKKIDNSQKKIKLIDFIKKSRKISQNPKILNLIKNDDYVRKRKIEEIPLELYSPRIYNSLSLDKTLKSLNQGTNKIARNYIKKNIDLNQMNKVGGNYIIGKNDINKLNNISCAFDINKSSYTANSNEYKISDAQKEDPEKEFYYPRKPIIRFNPISNRNQTLYPPPYKFQRWGTFSENYFVLSHTKNGFKRKGGLFTELVNKNNDKMKFMKDDIKKRLKLKRENEKIQKEQLFQERGFYTNNLDFAQLNQINKLNNLTPSNSMNNILIGQKFKEMLTDNTNNKINRNNNNFIKFNSNSYNKDVQ